MLTIGKRHNSLDSFKFLDNTNYNQQMYGHLQDGRFDLESQRADKVFVRRTQMQMHGDGVRSAKSKLFIG